MIANYHTHTPRCHHAQGSEEAYARCAIEAGLQTLGFSDHTPYPFPDNYVSSFRMPVSDLPGYAHAVRAVAKAFSGQLQIHLGVEAEYYPKYFDHMVSLLRDNGVEYMILGQHMLGNEVGERYLGIPTDAEGLERYCNQSIDAMHTGLFTYFAHPDIAFCPTDPKLYQQQMRRLCQAAKACQLPLEINLLGIRDKKHYPNRLFWEVVAEEGCPVILGRDAHQPEALLEAQPMADAMALVQAFDLQLLQDIPLRLL